MKEYVEESFKSVTSNESPLIHWWVRHDWSDLAATVYEIKIKIIN